MEIGHTGKKITFDSKSSTLWYLFDDNWRVAEPGDPEVYNRVREVYDTYRKSKEDPQLWNPLLQSCINYLKSIGLLESCPNSDLKFLLDKLIDFFSEFEFVPNFRFTNTFIRETLVGRGTDYVVNYFRLQDSVCAEDVRAKMESLEFTDLLKDFASIVVTKEINQRLKIYYGPQGTGKTTTALKETSECMVCHSAMLPSDLMEDFKFVDGKATFSPSPLWRSMEEGRKIVLDEINLLPFESLRFLQSLLDGKKSFLYKSQEVNIKDGFEVIGTMNLVVNGMKYPLPEPLVDRCKEIREFTMTSDLLMGAV